MPGAFEVKKVKALLFIYVLIYICILYAAIIYVYVHILCSAISALF